MGFNERHREMYLGGRPGASAMRANRTMARLAAAGLTGWWLIRLDTVNPKSGTRLALPLVTAKVDGRRYVVSMLGQGARWVRNVLAADGHAVIRAGRRRDVVLTMVDVNLRALIIKNYLRRAPGGRPHIPVDKDAPLADFEAVAAAYPVFEIRPAERRRTSRWR
ncbi:nitroreductase family deazaflavin-dependent oxidoreductase [Cryobacterium sp. PH31-AA6]|uniref:nitroreductase family deazaflavin-dependent oxidoreductase n=1 Tax=Cryobacterium sp. PH31-AA6 TaxID=3046205 RepID=UPI0024BB47ED|nr:nitroreductase family deazaflavin-dependent oxidoreductase [Cryobacterium sp. PH31-AA6]MDJ0325339.1 nitroreductase family deazaflavin-dependent oxidoreductase [Cryobacterium sp. PH31-AA6]